MTLNEIKTAAAAYHGKTSADFTLSGTDLFLIAANNARRDAELRHNFEFSRVKASLSINGTSGANISAAIFEDALTSTTLTVAGATGGTSHANGTYYQSGIYNGLPYFTHLGTFNQSWILFYNTGVSQWQLVQFFDFPSAIDYWSFATASTSPVGTYTPHNGATGSVTVAYSVLATFSDFKEITLITRTRPGDGTEQPIDFTRQDIAFEQDRYELELSSNFWPEQRYPSDADIIAGTATTTLVQRGGKLFVHPIDVAATSPLDVNLYGIGLLSDYTATHLTQTEPSDFFVKLGASFLLWSVIIEANYRWKTFVPRTEGDLGPPEQAKAQAWKDLLTASTYMVDSNLTRSR